MKVILASIIFLICCYVAGIIYGRKENKSKEKTRKFLDDYLKGKNHD